METAEKYLISAGNIILFVIVSIIFLPAFLIVNSLQGFWSEKLSDIFGV